MKLLTLLKKHNVPGENILLEITERLFVDNDDCINKTLESLPGLGCKFAIDDFGTGYSSLNYLHRINASVIKVDRSFVIELLENEKIVLGIQTIAKL